MARSTWFNLAMSHLRRLVLVTCLLLSNAASALTISGTVLLDVDGDGALTDAAPVSGATVRLFRDLLGEGSIDILDLAVAVTTTGTDGGFAFSGLPASPITGAFYYVVVSSDFPHPTTGAVDSDAWAEQTVAPVGGFCANGFGGQTVLTSESPCFGGRSAASDNQLLITTAEHVARVSIGTTNVTGRRFGFSYRVVTHARDGDDIVDSARSVQGSLRQALTNAQVIPGPETLRFTPITPPDTNVDGASWWRLQLSNPVEVTGGATLDGHAWCNGIQCTLGQRRDMNPGVIGVSDRIGLGPDGREASGDEAILSPIERPELELAGDGIFPLLVGEDSALSGVAIPNLGVVLAGDRAVLSQNLIGTRADGTVDAPSTQVGVTLGDGANDLQVSGNRIMVDATGIRREGSGARASITSNTITRPPDGHSAAFDGLVFTGDADDVSADDEVAKNLIQYQRGAAIAIGSPENGPTISGLEVSDNSLFDNGRDKDGAPSERPVGVVALSTRSGSHLTLERNIVRGNAGPGVCVTTSAQRVRVTGNALSGNDGLGLDLDLRAANAQGAFCGDGVTPNDGATSEAAANIGLDYPVIHHATLGEVSGTEPGGLSVHVVAVAGHVGLESSPTAGVLTLEVFLATDLGAALGEVELGDGDSVIHGEGFAFIGACTTETGRFDCTLALPEGLVVGDEARFVATATDAFGNTSELGVDLMRPLPDPEPDPEPNPETGPEPAPEAGPEPGPETRPEPGPETGPEPGPESNPEPAADSDADSANDDTTNSEPADGAEPERVSSGDSNGCTGGPLNLWLVALGGLMAVMRAAGVKGWVGERAVISRSGAIVGGQRRSGRKGC